MKHNYTSSVRDAVKDFYLENFGQTLTDEDVNNMDRHDVLDAYLSWEGIIGYTWLIESIMEN